MSMNLEQDIRENLHAAAMNTGDIPELDADIVAEMIEHGALPSEVNVDVASRLVGDIRREFGI